tara:strand:- start:19176 stop:19505 length:330 start_codon:yes stop_codon:yes gene_type:complete
MIEQHPLQTGPLVKWSLGLLVVSLGCIGLLGASMLRWLPRGLLFGISAMKISPFVFIMVWAVGLIVAYRRYRSIQFAAALAGIGFALFIVLPVCFGVGVLVIYGFPNLK